MDMPSITQAMRDKMGEDSGLNATLKFDCGDDGVVVLDGGLGVLFKLIFGRHGGC